MLGFLAARTNGEKQLVIKITVFLKITFFFFLLRIRAAALVLSSKASFLYSGRKGRAMW